LHPFDPFGNDYRYSHPPTPTPTVDQFFNLFSSTSSSVVAANKSGWDFVEDPAIMHARVTGTGASQVEDVKEGTKFNQVAAKPLSPPIQPLNPQISQMVPSTPASVVTPIVYSTNAKKSQPAPKRIPTAPSVVPSLTPRSPAAPSLPTLNSVPTSLPLVAPIPTLTQPKSKSLRPGTSPSPPAFVPSPFSNKNLFSLLQSPADDLIDSSSDSEEPEVVPVAPAMTLKLKPSVISEETAQRMKALCSVNVSSLTMEQLAKHIEEVEAALKTSQQDVHELEVQLRYILNQINSS